MSRKWQRPDGEVMEESFRLAWQVGRLCGENNRQTGPRRARGAQGQVSEEVPKCDDEQCVQGDRPAWLQAPLCPLLLGSSLLSLRLSFLLCENEDWSLYTPCKAVMGVIPGLV